MQIVDFSRRSKSRLLISAALAAALILAITGITVFYVPRTWGSVFKGQLSAENDAASFFADLALSEEWVGQTWTRTQGTELNMTLVGHPLMVFSGEIDNSQAIRYSWTENLNPSITSIGRQFSLKVPYEWGSAWSFSLKAEGSGSINMTITKFNPANFTFMILYDLLAVMLALAALRILYYSGKGKTPSIPQT